MKIQLHQRHSLIILFFLCPFFLFAQDYEWEWGLTGGGPNGSITGYDPEEIYDIKVGVDSNYYFIASVAGRNGIVLDGLPQIAYNNNLGNRDIFLFSTTCDGSVRWSRAIGGGGRDYSYNLVLDSSNNVYISARVSPTLNLFGVDYPVYFSENDSVITPNQVPGHNPQWPTDDYLPMEFYKRSYLVKYDSNGNYITRKVLASDELAGIDFHASTEMYRRPYLYNLIIDSQDNLHFMGAFGKGNYMDDNITIPSNYYYNAFTGKGNVQYRMIKCDSNLEYISDMVLPVADSTGFASSQVLSFAYDENLNRYIIGGMRSIKNGEITPLIYDGKEFQERSFVLVINGNDGGEIWRREIHSASLGNNRLADNRFMSLVLDTNSDIYFGGVLWRKYDDDTAKIYDPHNPEETTYPLILGPHTYLPTVVKFNSNGTVQWVKTPTDFASNFTTNTSIRPKGLTLNGNEIALGSNEGYFVWDSFTQNYPSFHGTSPTILRFDKQTGTTVGMDYIIGPPGANNFMTALAADSDGNYIAGGSFGGSFGDPSQNMGILTGIGQSDFFVAKLANSECGSGLSTESFNTLKINAYPNPTTDIVNIESDEKISYYKVFNELAQAVKVTTQQTNNNYQINLEGMASGLYFILLKSESGKSITVKVIKE